MITHTGIIHRTLFPSLLWRMPGKKIFLTFDDGPHPRATTAVLDTLKRHGVRATFFLTGKNIPGQEDLVRRIAREGHSVGIHAYSHTRLSAFSKERTKEEIILSEKILSGIIDQQVRLYRPPYGFFTFRTVSAARELGYLLVMWSCLTGDFRPGKIERIVQESLKKLAHGSILVFHDNELTHNSIADILDTVIPEIKKRGFEFGAIR